METCVNCGKPCKEIGELNKKNVKKEYCCKCWLFLDKTYVKVYWCDQCKEADNGTVVKAFEDKDMFRQLFQMQRQFDQTGQKIDLKETLLGNYYPALADTLRLPMGREPKFMNLPKETRVLLLMSALIGEAKETQEALGLLPEFGAKWWKKNINWDLVQEELIDCLHFLLSAFINARMTPDDVFKEYQKKWETNFKRQDNNY